MAERKGSELLISYKTLRLAIGVLGMLLPLVVIVAGWKSSCSTVRDSVSAYYHSNMRDFFVGLLFMVGVFLLSYNGPKWYDRALSGVSGLAALGVAAFPTVRELAGCPPMPFDGDTEPLGVFLLAGGTSKWIHYGCAVALFLSLAAMSLFLFTMSDKKKEDRTSEKQARNRIYVACGVTMVAAMSSLLIFKIPAVSPYEPRWLVLLIETVCLVAFGFSWLTKSEALFLRDEGAKSMGAEPPSPAPLLQ